MTSRQFFGNFKFKDINIYLYNDKGGLIYENHTTTFANVNPLIDKEVADAISDYKANYVFVGEPVKCEIFTTPSWNTCEIDLLTKKKTFKNE